METRVKMGTVVPKMGTVLHPDGIPGDYRAAIALALHAELGSNSSGDQDRDAVDGSQREDREILVRG